MPCLLRHLCGVSAELRRSWFCKRSPLCCSEIWEVCSTTSYTVLYLAGSSTDPDIHQSIKVVSRISDWKKAKRTKRKIRRKQSTQTLANKLVFVPNYIHRVDMMKRHKEKPTGLGLKRTPKDSGLKDEKLD